MSGDVDRTLWVGNLSDKVTDEILYELFLQAGPLEKVFIAKEKDGRQKSFAFVTFSHDVSVPYTIQLMDGLHLFDRPLRLQSRPGSMHQQQQQQQYPQQNNSSQHQLRNMNSPSQHSPPVRSNGNQNVYYLPVPMNHTPSNPYMRNQPMRGQASNAAVQSPSYQRSHTWHGSDNSSSIQQVRDYEERDNRDKDRYSDVERERDRSNIRRRHDNTYSRTEDYRHSPNRYSNNDNGDDTHKYDRAGHHSRPTSHHNRRTHYN